MTRTALAPLLAAALLLAGCGDDAPPADRTAAETAAPPSSGMLPAPTQQATPTETGFLDENPEGRFRVYWPDGCGAQRQRELDSRLNPGAVAAVEVSCQREGDPDHGCQVIAYNETATGEEPTPEMVARTIGDYIERIGAQVTRQTGIVRRDGVEGVAVFCRETGGPRRVWIQGFIDGGRVFLAIAWGPDDSLYADPQVRRFFDTLENTAS